MYLALPLPCPFPQRLFPEPRQRVLQFDVCRDRPHGAVLAFRFVRMMTGRKTSFFTSCMISGAPWGPNNDVSAPPAVVPSCRLPLKLFGDPQKSSHVNSPHSGFAIVGNITDVCHNVTNGVALPPMDQRVWRRYWQHSDLLPGCKTFLLWKNVVLSLLGLAVLSSLPVYTLSLVLLTLRLSHSFGNSYISFFGQHSFSTHNLPQRCSRYYNIADSRSVCGNK